MILFIPVYVEEMPGSESVGTVYIARPLQEEEPARRGGKLPRLLMQLQSALQTHLTELSHGSRHDDAAKWCRLPEYQTSVLDVRIELKGASYVRRFLFAGYEALGRRLYFTPKLPQLHFEVTEGQRLLDRATEVLTQHFRETERREDVVDLDDHAVPKNGKARMTMLEIEFKPARNAVVPKVIDFAAIFGGDNRKLDGYEELRKVGRRLNGLPADELPKAVGREELVEDVERRLKLKDRRAILLVGPRQVGKTAIIMDVVRRMVEDKSSRRQKQFWLVSPMRMISGMSHVGQWQNRVQAICDYLGKSDGILYLDDLPGLFTAGRSAKSELSVAQLIKPRLENGALRLLAEITPESWRVLKERDRALAELFLVVPVAEPKEADTVRILVNVARELERAHRCRFDLEVVPAAYELHRRFASDAAFPGKAASFLKRLAVKYAGLECTRRMALEEFRERSGLLLAMLDSRAEMERSLILAGLREKATGQDPVLEAFADVLIKLKARLNDPRRPLAAFLLLGPTGVGKTQCAKALANYLFGSQERLLRFDMNEMVDGSAVARLSGTPSQPEGLLTGAVRRQPFSVVLFDEIEKAAPEVFDMLLGVLDEGRLSDALGRVADFTSCVILLTSNLGVREAGAAMGFGRAGTADVEAAYVKAAEKFFRPEFFNRLDRVLPFQELSGEHLAQIAGRLIDDLMKRDGLRQRRCMVDLTAEAMTRLVELGHHPQLGARALKRVIEREVAQPLAADLAARAPGTPLRLRLGVADGRFLVHTQELRPATRTVFWPERLSRGEVSAPAVVDAAYDDLDRLGTLLETHAPTGTVEVTAVTPQQARYYQCREQLQRVERLLKAAEAGMTKPPSTRLNRAISVPRAKAVKVIIRQYYGSGNVRTDREREAQLLRTDLSDMESPEYEIVETPLFAAVRELCLLALMLEEPYDDGGVGWMIAEESSVGQVIAWEYGRRLNHFFSSQWGAVTEKLDHSNSHSNARWWAAGPSMARLVRAMEGYITVEEVSGSLYAMTLQSQPCASAAEAGEALKSAPESEVIQKELEVVQQITSDLRLRDHRSGLSVPMEASAEELRGFYLTLLPLPTELAAVFDPPPST